MERTCRCKCVPFIVVLAVLAVVMSTAGAGAFPQVEDLMEKPELKELDALKQDIVILNLLNVLYLTEDQIDQLLDLHQRRQAMIREVQEDLVDRAVKSNYAFKALRHALIAGDVPQERVSHLAAQTEHGIIEASSGIKEKFSALGKEAEQVLNDSQKVIVEHYQPCIIPPQNEINPLRVGQSGGEGPRKRLEFLRQMPDDKYRERKDMMIDRMYKRFKNKAAGRHDVSLEGVREQIAAMFDDVRTMSEADFRLFDAGQLKDALDEKFKRQHPKPIEPKIRLFLLHPRTELLLRRIKDR